MTTAELELPKASAAVPIAMTIPMKALVYHGPGKRAWEDKPRPSIQDAGDAIVRITTSTICGTDLHTLKGHSRPRGDWCRRRSWNRRLGVPRRRQGHHSCVTACLKCDFCRKQMYSHCRHGGWFLGYTIDGTQAEYVRIPQADGSLYHFPDEGDEEAMVMLSDICRLALSAAC